MDIPNLDDKTDVTVNNGHSLEENIKRGGELSHLTEKLFERCSDEWHTSVILEMITGILMVLISELYLEHGLKLILALIGFCLFGVAYYLRFNSEDTFETAETMRRQAAFSEGLGWPINNHQFAEWKLRAGKKVLEKFKNTPRPNNFFATGENPGPRKLLQISLESCFWGRILYIKLRNIMWALFFLIAGVALAAIILSFLRVLPMAEEIKLVSSVLLLLPAILIFDILDWILKLYRLTESMKEIEIDMERLDAEKDVTESQVMRLVSEFNCEVSSGFPIHQKLYNHFHDEIQELWETRKEK